MFPSKNILVVLLLAISQLAIAASSHVNRNEGANLSHRTNAARMAMGFPPLPPRELQARTGGGHHYPPTPPKPHNPQPSPGGPGKPDCDDKKDVRIKVKKCGGSQLGWISNSFSKKGGGKNGQVALGLLYGLASGGGNALKVEFENSVTPFDLKLSNGGAYPFLGFAGNNLSAGSSASAVLTSTQKTGKGVGPSNVGNSYSSWSANSESQIWYYTRASKAIEAKWINSGGSPSSKIYYNPDEDVFHIVGDTNKFSKQYTKAFEVEFALDD